MIQIYKTWSCLQAKAKQGLVVSLASAMVAFFVSGCASPHLAPASSNHRMGFFDRMGTWEAANSSSPKKHKFSFLAEAKDSEASESPESKDRADQQPRGKELSRKRRMRGAARVLSSAAAAEPAVEAHLEEDGKEIHDGHTAAHAVELSRLSGVGGLKWPLNSVAVTSDFGRRGREFHEGVDLKALTGTPVFAAQSGKILYADSKIRGYGKMVVIQHAKELATVYAHISKILVRKGQRVIQGQKIALSGRTGRVSGPHLHFETRRGLAAVDPLKILPTLKSHSLAAN
ncbi:MAG: M23 family metallopeptidase [Bdellovibrio sp.]|nr:M23 family metallopeptidase [Bdellovibrio sp.]